MKTLPLLVAMLWPGFSGPAVADESVANELHWNVGEDFPGHAQKANPHVDRDGELTWHFLRTTGINGPVETRQWLRDGKYVPLTEQGDKLFDSPLDGWAYRAGQRLAPLLGKVTAEYDVGLKFKAGDMLVAPGPEHAVVIGWRSPVAGMLEIHGVFEHAQNCCGANSQIQWYVERGPAPDDKSGFQPTPLVSGNSDFGSPNQVGEFHIKDQPIQPGDFIYFIVDAVADGTGTPHHGDATRFDVTLTVRDAKRSPPPSFERDVLPVLAQKCHECHGATVQEAKLDLRTLSALLQGGESGPAIVVGDPGGSLLVDLVAQGQMPPEGSETLTAAELATIRRWVKARTPAEEQIVALPPRTQVSKEDRQFWAFQPPRKSEVPLVQHVDRVRSPIDAFLHRQIMLSSAYRQSSRRPPVDIAVDSPLARGEKVDPGNALLWRMNLRRLESEIVRDSILTASGALDRTAGGPPVEITKPADGLSEAESHRRSLYLFARRVYPLKFLEIFDSPIMPVNCTQRMSSATVLQSLAQLNSEFLFEQADRMAQRVAETAGADSAARLELAFQLAVARKPRDSELKHSEAFVSEQATNHESADAPADKAAQMALADLCHMLLSTSEFLYVE